MKYKYNYFEGAASLFVVGLGQILKGQTRKGLKLILAFYFALPGIVIFSLAVLGKLFLLILSLVVLSAIILWSYSVVDALSPSTKLGARKP